MDLPVRVRTSKQRNQEFFFFHDLYTGCEKKGWHRLKMDLLPEKNWVKVLSSKLKSYWLKMAIHKEIDDIRK